MAKWRALFFVVSLVVWATRVDTPVSAQTQTTDKKAQDMAGIEKFHRRRPRRLDVLRGQRRGHRRQGEALPAGHGRYSRARPGCVDGNVDR